MTRLQRALDKAVQSHKSVLRNLPVSENAPLHLKIGIKGENSAAEYLESEGYSLLARNVNCRLGEIDIVARDGDEIVFVEVRTRSVGYILPADRTVGPDKLRKLIRAANIWVEKNNYNGYWRIDLVAITIDKDGNEQIEHIKEITEGIK